MKSVRRRLTACAVGVTMLLGCLPFGVSAEMDAQIVQGMIAKHREEYAELTDMIDSCKSMGMQIKYEESSHAVLGQFTDYMEDNLSRNDTANAYDQDRELTEIYRTTKAKLRSYLAGTAQPPEVPSYVTSDISVVGKHFEATVEKNGVTEQSPVFFVGAGHWAPSRKEIPVLSKIGFNTMQPELGSAHFMSKEDFLVYHWTERKMGEYPVTYDTVTDEKHGGARAFKVTSVTPQQADNYWYMQQTVQVKPNTTYQYGLWAKAPNGAAGTWFHVHPGWDWDTRSWVSGVVADWQGFSAEYTTGAQEYTLTFVICVEKPTEVWLDDAYIQEKGKDENLLRNGDFETTERDDTAYWKIDENQLTSLARDFDRMAEYNISGILSTAPHLVPDAFREDYPDAMSPKQPYFSSRTILDHPQTRAMYEAYYRAIMPHLAGKPAFNGIILMNEPEYLTNRETYYLPLFRAEMQKKYGSVEALNAKWGTAYGSFDEVAMPAAQAATAQFHDWREFNDTILPSYNRFAAELVKEYDKDVFTTTKMMQTMFTDRISRADACNNWETMAPTLDINGCDAYTNYATRNEFSIRAQDIFYDYQTSVKRAPVYNTEEHIFYFADQIGYSEAERAHNIAALWQGAVHGRGGTVVWFWDRTGATQNGGESYYSCLTERPATVAAMGKMTMDLNRLAKEVVAITEAQANVGMLYSMDNTAYAGDYMHTIYTAYAKLGENGQKTQFVATDTAESLAGLRNLKCLVVPHVVAVNDAGFEAVKNFADGGGKLVILGEDSLSKDAYGNERNAAEVAALKEKAAVVGLSAQTVEGRQQLTAESAASVGRAIDSAVSGYGNVRIIDKATGEPLTDCEYLTAKYNGRTVVNLCTYRDDDREIEVYLNGEKAEGFTDLISTKAYRGSAQAKAYTPMLLAIETGVHTSQIVKELRNTSELAGVSYSANEAYEGDWSVHVNYAGNWSLYPIAAKCAEFGMTTGARYDISFYFKGSAESIYVTAKSMSIWGNAIYAPGGDYPDVGQTITTLDNGWSKFEVKNYALTNADNALLYTTIGGNSGDKVNDFYLDNLSIVDENGNELVQNGSFEPAASGLPEEEPIRKYTANVKDLLNDSYVRGVSYSADEARDGQWSVHIKNPENGRGISAKWLDFGLDHNKVYNVRFYLKGNVKRLYTNIGNARIMFDANSPTEPKKNNSTDSLSPTGWATSTFEPVGNGWYYLNWTNAHTGEASDWADSLPLFSIDPETDNNKGSGDFYLDGLSIKEVDADGNEGPELIVNGSFEPPAMEFGEYAVERQADGTATVTIEALNHTAGDNAAPQFVFAAYNSSGLASCMPMERKAIAQNNKWQPLSFTIRAAEGDRIAAYVWDSIESLKPLWTAKTILN